MLLKNDPLQAESPLNSYTKMPLAALVGAVAPNLDVAIDIVAEKGTKRVARPGDWLQISDAALLRRLNPQVESAVADPPKSDRALMQTVTGADGQVYGRAFISPSEYWFSTKGGWATVSGLRASKLYNIEGVMLGEAITAARPNLNSVPKNRH